MAIAVVFNPISGSGRAERVASGLRDALELEGWIIDMVPTERAPASAWLAPWMYVTDFGPVPRS